MHFIEICMAARGVAACGVAARGVAACSVAARCTIVFNVEFISY